MGRRIADPRPTTAFATVDFDKPGKQVGFVMIPHSPHEDAWGVTRVPIAIIANGSGPTRDHRRQPWRRVRGADRHLRDDPRPRSGDGQRPADPDALLNASRGARRDAHLPGRRQELQPHLPRQPARHDVRADFGLSLATRSSRSQTPFLTSTPAARRCRSCRAPSSSRPTTPRCIRRTSPRRSPSARRRQW